MGGRPLKQPLKKLVCGRVSFPTAGPGWGSFLARRAYFPQAGETKKVFENRDICPPVPGRPYSQGPFGRFQSFFFSPQANSFARSNDGRLELLARKAEFFF